MEEGAKEEEEERENRRGGELNGGEVRKERTRRTKKEGTKDRGIREWRSGEEWRRRAKKKGEVHMILRKRKKGTRKSKGRKEGCIRSGVQRKG